MVASWITWRVPVARESVGKTTMLSRPGVRSGPSSLPAPERLDTARPWCPQEEQSVCRSHLSSGTDCV